MEEKERNIKTNAKQPGDIHESIASEKSSDLEKIGIRDQGQYKGGRMATRAAPSDGDRNSRGLNSIGEGVGWSEEAGRRTTMRE